MIYTFYISYVAWFIPPRVYLLWNIAEVIFKLQFNMAKRLLKHELLVPNAYYGTQGFKFHQSAQSKELHQFLVGLYCVTVTMLKRARLHVETTIKVRSAWTFISSWSSGQSKSGSGSMHWSVIMMTPGQNGWLICIALCDDLGSCECQWNMVDIIWIKSFRTKW